MLGALLVAVAAGVTAPAASAYRSPTKAERQAVVRAFDKHHGSKAKKLNIEQIRVSTVNSRYFGVLYNDKVVSGGKTYTFGYTTLEYYVRPKAAGDPGRASPASFTGQLDFTGSHAPSSVKDDDDPLYEVTYRTTPHQGGETVTRDVNHEGCGMSHSEGNYRWFVIWKEVPLTLPDLAPIGAPSVDFIGSVTWNDPCPTRSQGGSNCPSHGTITYKEGGVSTLSTDAGFAFNPLNVSAGYSNDNHYVCPDITTLAAQPIDGVVVDLPFHRNGHAFADKTFSVDESNFNKNEKANNLANCDRGEAGYHCTEKVQFHAEVIAKRQHRGP